MEPGLITPSGCYDDKHYEDSCEVLDMAVSADSGLVHPLIGIRWGYQLQEEAQRTPAMRPIGPALVVLAEPKSQQSPCLETVSMANDMGPKFDICFSPGASNPAVEDPLQLREWLHSWLPSSIRTSQWKTIDNWRIPRFVELTYPTCKDPEDARLLIGWITWLHLFDDEFDRPPISHDRDAAKAYITPYLHCISALRSGRTLRGSSMGDLLRMFVDLNERTVASMSQAWRKRWFDDMHSYIRASIIETTNRAKGIILAPEELILLKRTCMAQRTVINLIERVTTEELSPAVCSLVSPVVDIVSDITGSVNDPISLARERSRGDTHNMIISLVQHQLMTEAEAVEHLVQFVRIRCHDLAEAIRTIPDDPIVGKERENVAMWLTTCGHWVRGYHDWLLETRRYKMSSLVSGALPAAEPLV